MVLRPGNNKGPWLFKKLAYAPVRMKDGRGHANMQLIIALIVIVYLVGVGVVLSPVVQSGWNSEPASALAENVAQALPHALAWPARVARSASGS
jgi:hypothetical protein